MTVIAEVGVRAGKPLSRLTKQHYIGFFGCWLGWVMDGVDSFIFALVFVPSMRELLPASGIEATGPNIAFAGSMMFALFLIGWGMAFIWGPLGDKWGRAKTLSLTIIVYSVFTAAAAFAQDVYQLAAFRFLAGIGVGGEWALAGTFIAEIWPEDRRAKAGGYLQTGYYVGFFIASALNFTVGAHYGWRAMFLCGLAPVVIALAVRVMIKEPQKWEVKETEAKKGKPLREIFSAPFRQRTIVLTSLLTCSIIGLWAGAVYAPAALTELAIKAGYQGRDIPQLVSYSSMLFSFMTIVGCLTLPFFAEALGRAKSDRPVLPRHDAVDSRGVWLSVLSAKRAGSVHHRNGVRRILWGQLRDLQHLDPRAIPDDDPCDGLRLGNFVWSLYRGRRQFSARLGNQSDRHAWHASRHYRNRVRHRYSYLAMGDRDEGQRPTRITTLNQNCDVAGVL